MSTQELLTKDQQLTRNPAYPMFNLIEVLKVELKSKTQQLKAKDEQLKAKDEQLKAKDQQIAQLMHVLQIGLIRQLSATEPATEEPTAQEPVTEEPAAAQESAAAEEPEVKGFWAAVRKRFGR